MTTDQRLDISPLERAIQRLPNWRGYRAMHAKTSHTDDEDTALAVVAGIPGFLEEARYLRDRLRERLA